MFFILYKQKAESCDNVYEQLPSRYFSIAVITFMCISESAVVLIDTAGCDCWELETSDDQSKGNVSESIIVSCQVEALIAAGVPEKDIAVITPYNLQV